LTEQLVRRLPGKQAGVLRHDRAHGGYRIGPNMRFGTPSTTPTVSGLGRGDPGGR